MMRVAGVSERGIGRIGCRKAEGRKYETAAEMLARVKAGANTNAIGKAAKNPRAKGKRGRA